MINPITVLYFVIQLLLGIAIIRQSKGLREKYAWLALAIMLIYNFVFLNLNYVPK